jgi:release factor glutamine methyltransferase
LDAPVTEAFTTLLARRLAYEPIAYITGTRAFWTLELAVTPAVLVPRPDSETLIEAALAHFTDSSPRHILDLGTGSGALLLAALREWPEATGVGVDASAPALAIAQQNAVRLGFTDRALFRLGNWCDGLAPPFDLILCNPPYVESDAQLSPEVATHEPASALYAGSDGLNEYRCLIPQLPAILAPGGITCLEIGHTQRAAVTALAEAQGFKVVCRQDLGKRDRCLVLSL